MSRFRVSSDGEEQSFGHKLYDALYQAINSVVREQPATISEIIGMIELVKTELLVGAIDDAAEDCADDGDERSQPSDN